MVDPQSSTDAIDYRYIQKRLDSAIGDEQLFEAIVNTPFVFAVEMAMLFLGIIVLLQVNKNDKTIDRIALSNTEPAARTKQKSVKEFEDIKIPIGHDANIIAKAIKTGTPQGTSDWQYLFTPVLTPQEARFNQADGGIAFSAVYPLKSRDGGAMIFSYFQYPDEIGEAQRAFMEKYSLMADTALGN